MSVTRKPHGNRDWGKTCSDLRRVTRSRALALLCDPENAEIIEELHGDAHKVIKGAARGDRRADPCLTPIGRAGASASCIAREARSRGMPRASSVCVAPRDTFLGRPCVFFARSPVAAMRLKNSPSLRSARARMRLGRTKQQ